MEATGSGNPAMHEMVHLIEPSQNERFVGLVEQHFPGWREARAELNALPLTAQDWRSFEHPA